MIDWFAGRPPLEHDGELFGGRVLCLFPTGELDWQAPRFATLEGSHSAKVQVKSDGPDRVYVSGNLVKLQQGHNVFGSTDLVGLVAAFGERLAGCLGAGTARDRARWWAGEFEVSRVDVTESVDLGSRAAVLSWIRSAAVTARSRHRGPSLLRGDTLYFGRHSRRWAVKAYSKGQEIAQRGRELPEAVDSVAMRGYADKALRLELVLRSLALERLGMRRGSSWTEAAARRVYEGRIGALEMSEQVVLADSEVEALPTRVRSSYQLWKEGHDVRAFVGRSTFYRHRKELLAHGVDIAELRPRTREREAVPLLPVLQGRWMGVPEWAVGTPLYYEPRKSEAAKLRLVSGK